MRKDITFFIKTLADRQLYHSIIMEARKRGYTAKITDNPREQCEIGVYCQHENYPENSKFSIIMLHDLIQAYPRWPDIWEAEPWNKYDIGMLPTKFWVDMWKKASYKPWCMPRLGVYEVGWPKADIVASKDFNDTVKKLSDELKLDKTKKTVLYAPSWENDNKQNDFVQAMLQLDVNILIKQGHIEKEWGAKWSVYYEVYDEINKMRELHQNIPNVRVLDTKINILHVIALADALVSEESSTMCEMVLMGKPVVAVEDWLIPDTIPRRTACKGHAFTVKATKATLKDTMQDVLRRYDFYQRQAVEFRDKNFLPIGNNAIKVMDIIDAAINEKHVPYTKETPMALPKMNLNYYSGTDSYSDGDVEERILHYICNNEPEKYSYVFPEDSEWAVFYHLTQFRKNLLNWYNFKLGASLMEIGAGMGGLTALFCEKCEHVTSVEMSKRRATAIQIRCRNYDNLNIVVGDFTKMEFERKYDYITVIGVLEYQSVFGDGDTPQLDFINGLKRFLAPGGKLIVAIENKFGLKYWTGSGDDHSCIPFGSINDFAYGGDARTFDRQELSDLLTEAGFKNQKFFYPLPDYKLPRLLYTDEYIVTDAYSEAQPLYYDRNHYGELPIVVDEARVREPIVRNRVFPFFANSFLVECSIDNDCFDDTVFASIQGGRTEKYQIITRFDGKQFFKRAVSQEAIPHIQQSYNNIINIHNCGVPVVEHQLNQGILTTPKVKSETAEQRFISMLRNKDIDGAKKLLDKLYKYIIQSSEEAEPRNNYVLKTDLIPEGESFDFGVILKSAYCDMTLFNCFYEGNDFLFFDQEWVFENTPANYVLFRAILMTYTRNQSLEKVCSIQYWKTVYNLESLWPIYARLEGKLFTPIFNTDSSVIASLSYVPPEMVSNNIALLRVGHEQLRQKAELELLLNNTHQDLLITDENLKIAIAQRKALTAKVEEYDQNLRVSQSSVTQLQEQLMEYDKNLKLAISQRTELEQQLADYVMQMETQIRELTTERDRCAVELAQIQRSFGYRLTHLFRGGNR